MKNIFSILFLVILNCSASAQGFDFFDFNNIKARINADGHLFWDEIGTASFEVPQGSGRHSIFAGGLWIGGYDNNGSLRTAAQTYRQGGGDFWPGPIGADTLNTFWHRVWKISREEIDTFVYEFNLGFPDSNYVIPEAIQSWPGSDSISLQQLLPYVDVDNDGLYNYTNGDYPCIKGDQAVAFIINDAAGYHHETGGGSLDVEVHGMAYGFRSQDSILNNTLFLNYKIISRNTTTPIDSCYIGSWTDFDLGYYDDDYIGCDVTRNMYYAYNGDNDDEGLSGYGINPPAQGVIFLKGPAADINDGVDNDRDSCIDCSLFHSAVGDSIVPETILPEYIAMSNFVYYENSHHPVNGKPFGAEDFYGYQRSIWRDGSHQTYGGNGHGGGFGATSDISAFMYPGNSDPYFWGTNGIPEIPWDEVSAGNLPGDRRGVASTGSFTMNPGMMICVDYAYVFARSNMGGPLASLDSLKLAADYVQDFYNAHTELNQCDCQMQVTSSVREYNLLKDISLFPNPAFDKLNLQFTAMKPANTRIIISDYLGREIASLPARVSTGKNSFTIPVSALSNGIYTLRLEDEPFFTSIKFIKY